MSKLAIITKREYLNIVRKKSFIVSAVLTPVLMIALILLPSLLAGVAVVKERTMAIIDGTDYVYESLDAKQKFFSIAAELMKTKAAKEKIDEQITKELKKKGLPEGQISKLLREMQIKAAQSFAAINFKKIEVTEANWEEKKEETLDRIRSKAVDVLLIIPKTVEDGTPAEYYSRSSGNFDETGFLQQFISDAVVSKRLADEGMDPVFVTQLTSRVGLSTHDVTKTGIKKGNAITSYLVAIIFVMLLFMAVMQTGQNLMRGVLEEKQNRIIEVLLSSIKPNQLMSGKIIGLGSAGLTLVTIWVAAGLIGLKFSGGMGVAINQITMIYFIIFFILGYLLYSTFMAILGAIMNSEQEAQHFITIITLSMMFPMFVAMIILKAPNSSLATILTMIPIFTPTMVVFRASIAPIPVIEVIIAGVILALFVWLMIILTTKIFRVGILMYGKKPTFKEVIKWMRYQ